MGGASKARGARPRELTKVRRGLGGDEKLRPVTVHTMVGHAHDARQRMADKIALLWWKTKAGVIGEGGG